MQNTKKFIVGTTIIALVFLVAPTSSRAEKVASTTNSQERRDAAKARLATVKQKVAIRKQQIIKDFSKRVTDRLTAAITRMRGLADKIDIRITKQLADHPGSNFDNAKAKLVIARHKLDLAQTAVNGVASQVDTALTANDGHDVFATVKDILKNVEQAVRDAQKALVDVLQSTKVGVGAEKAKEQATSTKSRGEREATSTKDRDDDRNEHATSTGSRNDD